MSFKIPVTVLTGFLGSGKTTLLNRILSENHGQRIAVIENEFGEISVDQDLIINADEEVFEMSNGCICCTVRGDLIRILGRLMQRRDKFDRVLLETTGLANPGPVAQTFFVDDDVRKHYALDGIVTLADARHLPLHLYESEEAREQVAFADVIVLNKTDLVSERELEEVERRLKAMNGTARMQRAHMARVPMEQVLGIGGFDLTRALDYKPSFLEPEYPFEWAGLYDCAAGTHTLELMPGPDPTMAIVLLKVEKGQVISLRTLAERAVRLFSTTPLERRAGHVVLHGDLHQRLLLNQGGAARFPVLLPNAGRYALFTQHLPEGFDLALRTAALIDQHRFAASHTHDDAVSSVSLTVREPLHAVKFQRWLGKLLRERGTDLFRVKGFLNFAGAMERFVIQGVHMLVDTQALEPWGERPRATQLVLIGRHLEESKLLTGLRQCCA